MSRVTHFEVPATDPEKSMKFYGEVFGWQFDRLGENDYWFAVTGDAKYPGINGAIMKRNHPQQPVTNQINVPDIDEAIAKIELAGGKIVVPKMTIPGAGVYCFFKDPDENIFGLLQNIAAAK